MKEYIRRIWEKYSKKKFLEKNEKKISIMNFDYLVSFFPKNRYFLKIS